MYYFLLLTSLLVTIGLVVVCYLIYSSIKDGLHKMDKMYSVLILTFLIIGMSSCATVKPADMSFNKETINKHHSKQIHIYHCNAE